LRPERRAAACTAAGLAITGIGLALNYWAWTLVGPLGLEPNTHFGLDQRQWALLGALTVVAGSLAAAPVGMAADRFRAPVVLAVVSTLAAVSVLALAAVGSSSALIVVAALAGVGGTALTAGAVVVVRICPPGWRPMALSVFSGGMGLATAAATATRPSWAVDLHGSLLILAASLLGYAVLAASLTRLGTPPDSAAYADVRETLVVVRTPAIGYLIAWYATAMCVMVTFDLYLPTFLHGTYHLPLTRAAGYAALCFGISTVSAPLGAWWCRRRQAASLLTGCFTIVGGALVALGLVPTSPVLFGGACVGLAVSAGLIAGTVFTLLGHTAPMSHFGAVTGLISGAAGLLGVLPPLLLTALPVPGHSYPVLMTALAGIALAAARRIYVRRSWVAAAAAFPAPVAASETIGTTVVAVSAAQIGRYLPTVVSALAALARNDELAIAYAVTDSRDGYALVSALRSQLPRHTVLALATADPPRRDEVDTLVDMLQTGTLPVALLHGSQPDISAITLARDLRADQAVHLFVDHVGVVRSATADPRELHLARLPRALDNKNPGPVNRPRNASGGHT
jgi:NNP family nitrate/nitrite transporter-like MFS transporter